VSEICEKALDPRVRRTRQMLRDAMVTLFATKSFDAISIQDIAEQATVNRATFYAHYVDKTDLLADILRHRFVNLLEAREVRFDGTCPSALKIVILAVYDFLKETYIHCNHEHSHCDPFIQTVVHSQVERVLFKGLEKGAFQTGRSPSLVAATLSWAIYGAATAALQEENPPEPETFVNEIFELVLPILIPPGMSIVEEHAHG